MRDAEPSTFLKALSEEISNSWIGLLFGLLTTVLPIVLSIATYMRARSPAQVFWLMFAALLSAVVTTAFFSAKAFNRIVRAATTGPYLFPRYEAIRCLWDLTEADRTKQIRIFNDGDMAAYKIEISNVVLADDWVARFERIDRIAPKEHADVVVSVEHEGLPTILEAESLAAAIARTVNKAGRGRVTEHRIPIDVCYTDVKRRQFLTRACFVASGPMLIELRLEVQEAGPLLPVEKAAASTSGLGLS